MSIYNNYDFTEEDQEEKIQQLEQENNRLRRQLRQKSERKKVEFSKVIFIGVSVLTLAITIFACIVIWTTKDTSALCYLIPAVFAEAASATGFYYSKAKAENKIKLAKEYGVKLDPKNFE